MDWKINFKEIVSTFMVLFAVIDITGSVPIILDLKAKGKNISSSKATIYSFIICIVFLFLGEMILSLFGVDISSFAVAGSLIILVLAIEMIFGVEIFKNDGPSNSVTLVPVIFPLIAGTGTLTTLLTIRAEYATINIIIALVLNMLVVYFVLSNINFVEKALGKGAIFVLKKFFGLILLAIAVKLFTTNIVTLF